MISLNIALSDMKYLLFMCTSMCVYVYISIYGYHTLLLASRHIVKFSYCWEVGICWFPKRSCFHCLLYYWLSESLKWAYLLFSVKKKVGARLLLIQNKRSSMEIRKGLTWYMLFPAFSLLKFLVCEPSWVAATVSFSLHW